MIEKEVIGVEPITCHAWNKDRTQLALSPNSDEVIIFRVHNIPDRKYEKLHVLKGHDLKVNSIDWAPNSNRIVTCSADRNAYVWTLADDKKWKPTKVLLRINRAATCVKWSPLENKFAVGSGARTISVCYFDKDNDWWVSRHIKKPIKSTVTSLSWHPNNVLLAAGSMDFKARIFSAYIKEIEDKPAATPWGAKMPLGQLMAEFSNSCLGGGWVHCVAFSPSGNRLCWVGHDASLSVVDSGVGSVVKTTRTENLPFLACMWISENEIVAAGHGCCPILYGVGSDGTPSFCAKMDTSQKKETSGTSAMRKFQSLDKQARSESADTTLPSVHQNSITSLSYMGSSGTKRQITTTGVDGAIGNVIQGKVEVVGVTPLGRDVASSGVTVCLPKNACQNQEEYLKN
ncbi:unnamed protein product [Notodromas monacha]|uniref:Actin-related protein 2/3 complex subunit n=1 Tax=Notodromas monacha TaxID=399045 RepID=A0A7R9BL20_9CRUS|nr:unnamed protein product [Notodromas monacha]CAG0915965.1 unnamed protein product [Notodromas monacha]